MEIEESNNDWAENVMEDCIEPKENLNINTPSNLKEFIESDQFSEQVKMRCDKTVGEIFLMLLKFCIMNSLSMTAVTNLFKLINTIFERPILPDSSYLIDKLLSPKSGVEYHAVCPHCSAYVGKLSAARLAQRCLICNGDLNFKNPNDPSFFVLINPTDQISNLIKTYEDHYHYVTNERVHEKGYLSDIYDGKMYRKLIKSLSEEHKNCYVTASFNTDGAPKFKSSKCSIWPLYLQINEIPAQDRLNNLITCGLWFNKKKPDMTVFIREFVRLINKVTFCGIPCVVRGISKTLRLYVINCCVDAVARAPIQGIKQFNAYFGCNFCLNPGVHAEGSIKFSNIIPLPKLRNHEDTLNIMLNLDTENQYGIKYPSPLINFNHFDLIKSFLPDYMHCCLEGVAKQFLNYFMESLSNDCIKDLDVKIKSIAVPNHVARLTRPISERNDWKARELENFVLYYSVPLLSSVIGKKKLNHWILFVESLYILLQEKSHISELEKADIHLHKFVFETQSLYGIRAMTYNLHLLLHLTESVVNWGPLWTNSTFPFETQNYYLLKAIKSSNGVTQQTVRYINMVHSMFVVENFVGRAAKTEVLLYCRDVLTAKVKNVFRSDGIVYFGKVLIHDEVLSSLSSSSTFYYKMVKDKCQYESSMITKVRSNNSFILLSNGQFACIHCFIVNSDNELTLCSIVSTKNCYNDFDKLLEVDRIEKEKIFVPTKNIKKICVMMNISNKIFISPVPNLLHY